MINSGDINGEKKKLFKPKAFNDTIQKVTNVSPRLTVLLSVWIINPQTKYVFVDLIMNIRNVDKLKITWYLKQITLSWQLLYLFTSSNRMHMTWTY